MSNVPAAFFDDVYHKQKICTCCGHKVYPQKKKKGSFGVEVASWLCFGIPGVVYSTWRRSNKDEECPICKGRNCLVPVSSNVGKEISKRFSTNT